jgi:hypothetical protein
MPTVYSGTGLCGNELGRWIFWNYYDACLVFGQETNEPSDIDDLYVFQHVLCDHVHGGVSDPCSEWSRFQAIH